MRRLFVGIFVAVLAAFLLSIAPLGAAVILPNLPAGSQYQLLFATADTRDASSSNIADYNAFVTTEAAPLNAILPPNVSWDALASTEAVSAINNVIRADVPVYNTQGIEIAPSSFALFTSELLAPVSYDQYGQTPDNANDEYYSWVWTGSNPDGTTQVGYALGDSGPTVGVSTGTWIPRIDGTSWIQSANLPNPYLVSLFGLSSPITVPVPEPPGLALLTTALLAFGGIRLLRANRS